MSPAYARSATMKPNSIALLVVGLCFLFNFAARGVSETYGVFLLPLEAEYGWLRGQLTGIYSIYMVAHGLAAPVMGILTDRLGARAVYTIGILSLGSANLIAGQIDQLWQLYLSIGVLGGIGVAALGMVPAATLVGRWFDGRLSTAMGITYAGFGCGTLIIVPAAQALVDHGGWRFAYTTLGFAVLSLLVLMFLPWRRIMAGPGGETEARRNETRRKQHPWPLKRLLRDGGFWGLFGVFFFTAFAIYAVTPQAIAFMVEAGFAPITAATAFGFLGLLSVAGVALSGWLADRLGRRKVVTFSFLMTFAGIGLLLALPYYPALPLLTVFVIVFGIVMGSRGPIVSTMTARLFAGGIGTAYGLITLGLGLGAGLGSWLSGLMHDLTGDYVAGFSLAALATLLGLIQFWIVPALRSEKVEQ